MEEENKDWPREQEVTHFLFISLASPRGQIKAGNQPTQKVCTNCRTCLSIVLDIHCYAAFIKLVILLLKLWK